MDIVFIGAGRLATHLAQALHRAGHKIVQVYSRTMQSATALATLVEAEPTDSIEAVATNADAYIIAISDKAIAPLLPQLVHGREGRVFLHTAGSVPLSIFSGIASHAGVLYPMQTFSKDRPVDFSRIHIYLEGTDDTALAVAQSLAASVSQHVEELSSERRRYLHLAAVFACNFTNHCYDLAAQILQRQGLPFSAMLPLIDETAAKVHDLSPREAQTGPAVRMDTDVIDAHKALLQDQLIDVAVYSLMTLSINNSQQSLND